MLLLDTQSARLTRFDLSLESREASVWSHHTSCEQVHCT